VLISDHLFSLLTHWALAGARSAQEGIIQFISELVLGVNLLHVQKSKKNVEKTMRMDSLYTYLRRRPSSSKGGDGIIGSDAALHGRVKNFQEAGR
jgi:hypothetical protein